MNEFIILAIPFLGTSIGAAMVFFLKKQIAPKFEKLLLGFAAGVMIAASVWSLLIPSIEMAEKQHIIEWVPALVGFMVGIVFLLLLDTLIPHLHLESDKPEGLSLGASKMTMMLLAVTLHNIPEGMSVGVAFAGAAMEGSGITKAAALALAVGIAIQNFPEGAIVSMPLRERGRGRAFLAGALSGIVEPIAAALPLLALAFVAPLMPYLLSFAAGAMMCVVVEELIPDLRSAVGTLSFTLGFVLMMALDVALG